MHIILLCNAVSNRDRVSPCGHGVHQPTLFLMAQRERHLPSRGHEGHKADAGSEYTVLSQLGLCLGGQKSHYMPRLDMVTHGPSA